MPTGPASDYYFKGKHELFHAVIIDAVQHLVDSAERIAAADVPAAERVRRLVAELMQAYTDHYPYLYVYVQEDMTRLAKDDASSTTLRRLAAVMTISPARGPTMGSDLCP